MKRLLNAWKVIVVVITIGIVAGIPSGWVGITTTPMIEGRLIDATTGKPVKDAIVVAKWDAQYLGLSVDSIWGRYKEKTAVSDSDGRFRIPADIHFHLRSRFDLIDIGIYHPLYETLRVRWPGIGQIDNDGNVKWNVKYNYLGGKINSDYDYWKYYAIARILGIDVANIISDSTFKTLLINNTMVKTIFNTDIKEMRKWKGLYE